MSFRPRPADAALALVLLGYLLPVWLLPRFPSQDGPSHVYNAYVLAQFASGAPEPLRDAFTVRAEPVPNWAGHLVLTGLMLAGIPPLAAEKVFLTLYLTGVALGSRFLLRSVARGQEAWAPLSLPLAFNFPLLMGFYNFLCGIPVTLFATALAWRWRDGIGLRRGAVLAALLVALYLAHLVDFGIGVVAVSAVVLVGARQRWSAAARLAPAFLPALTLIAWYATASDPDYLDKAPLWRVIADSDDSPSKLLGRCSASILTPTPHHDPRAGLAAVGLLAAVAVAGAARGLARDGMTAYQAFWEGKGAFFVATAELFALAMLFPQNWGHHGGAFTERLAIYIGLLTLAWLPTPETRRATACAVGLACGLAVANLGAVTADLRRGNAELSALLDPLPPLPEGSRVMPVLLNPQPVDQVLLLDHLADYLCLRPGVVDWANYEAHGFCFPVMFRPGVPLPDLDAFRRGEGPRLDADLDRTDVVLLGPTCPALLHEKVAARFPHSTPGAGFEIRSRRPLAPAAGPPG